MGAHLQDRELKKGSTDFLVLALLEPEPRHGYELSKLIERRSRGAALGVKARRVALRHLAKRLLHLWEDGRRPGVVQVGALQLSRGWGQAAG